MDSRRCRHSEGHIIGPLERIPVLSDNSCLFSSFNILLHGESKTVAEIRSIAAAAISCDSETFNDLTLERPRSEYLDWIMQPDSWGGYIELIALSRAYSIQTCVVDIQTGRVDEYGEEASGKRIYLIYDGIHYDAIAAVDGCCPKEHLTTFNPTDRVTLERVCS